MRVILSGHSSLSQSRKLFYELLSFSIFYESQGFFLTRKGVSLANFLLRTEDGCDHKSFHFSENVGKGEKLNPRLHPAAYLHTPEERQSSFYRRRKAFTSLKKFKLSTPQVHPELGHLSVKVSFSKFKCFESVFLSQFIYRWNYLWIKWLWMSCWIIKIMLSLVSRIWNSPHLQLIFKLDIRVWSVFRLCFCYNLYKRNILWFRKMMCFWVSYTYICQFILPTL